MLCVNFAPLAMAARASVTIVVIAVTRSSQSCFASEACNRSVCRALIYSVAMPHICIVGESHSDADAIDASVFATDVKGSVADHPCFFDDILSTIMHVALWCSEIARKVKR